MTTNNNQSTKNGDALFSEAPARIEPQRAPGSPRELTQNAEGSRVNGRRSQAYQCSVATSTLDKLELLLEVVMHPPDLSSRGVSSVNRQCDSGYI